MRVIGNGIGIPFRRNTGQGVIWPPDLKSALVCWYSPRKQKLTEYDVIESYAEDFTKFIKNGNGTFTQNKYTSAITKQEWLLYKTNGKEIEAMDIYITADGDVSPALRYYYYTNEDDNRKIFYLKASLNHLPASCYKEKGSTIGIVFEAQPTSEFNVTITQLPTSILKDFSGNGLDAYMYGFQGKLNSGVGIYAVDFTTYNNSGNQNVTDIKPNSFVLLAGALSRLGLPYSSIIGEYIPSYAIRIQGISGGTITYYYRNENGKQLTYVIDADGDYILPPCYSEGTEGTAVNIVSNNNIDNVTITQIPDYPNQLCYSGKEYCISYNQPILTDYTVIADRTWFSFPNNDTVCLASKATTIGNGAFIFELFQTVSKATNFGLATNVEFVDNEITYQTKSHYNSSNINTGTGKDEDILYIGRVRDSINTGFNGCHSDFLLFNRTLTQEEIDWVKNNCFVIDIPTPTYDFDFSKLKSGQDTFVDKYGNELSLYNFQWAGMSGKDGYIEDWTIMHGANRLEKFYNGIKVSAGPGTYYAYWLPDEYNNKEYVINLETNVSFNIFLRLRNTDGTVVSKILKPGLNTITPFEDLSKAQQINIEGNILTDNFYVKITEVPLYPRALIFDGIDDYASFQKTSKLIKSVIVDFIPLKHEDNHGIIYDQRLLGSGDVFAIYHAENLPAYSARNNGDTYIDGVLNTTLIPEQLTGKHMQVAITNNNILEMNKVIFIGCRGATPSALFYSAMALYRITGFTEVLTPDQVWKWYQKNQPKGGDK